jgi:hypothetical protein
MSDARADVTPVAQMTPITPSEKLARFKLLEAQIEATHGAGSGKAAQMKKAILANMSEEENIRNDVLLQISKYKPSTPEYYMLVSMCKGRTDAFDQAEFLANQIYETQKTEVAMSYFTPSKASVRSSFLESAKSGVEARRERSVELAEKIATKSVVAGLVAGRGGVTTSATISSE